VPFLAGPIIALYLSMNIAKTTTQIVVICSFMTIAQASRGPLCPSNIATTTMYYTPNVKDFCKSSSPCDAFRKVVADAGSGTLPGNQTLKYVAPSRHGKKHAKLSKKQKYAASNFKPLNMGNCDTAIGAAGKCLIPFVSVAADLSIY